VAVTVTVIVAYAVLVSVTKAGTVAKAVENDTEVSPAMTVVVVVVGVLTVVVSNAVDVLKAVAVTGITTVVLVLWWTVLVKVLVEVARSKIVVVRVCRTTASVMVINFVRVAVKASVVCAVTVEVS
jgi:hypothetical protein